MGYKAYKFKTEMSVDVWASNVMRYFAKALIDEICSRFNGLTRIGNWIDEEPYHSDPSYYYGYSCKAYFSLDGTQTKHLLLSNAISNHQDYPSDPDFPLYWSNVVRFGMCKPNNSGFYPDGIYTEGQIGFNDASTWEQMEEAGYQLEHWYMVYVDDNNNIVGISGFQREGDYYAEAGSVLLFERAKNTVYSSYSFYSGDSSTSTSILSGSSVSNITGDLYPKARIVHTGHDYYEEDYSNPSVLEECVIVKNLTNDFVKYEGSIPLKSFANYDAIDGYRLNQRIQVGNQLYIHLGGGRLFLPIDSYESVIVPYHSY